MARLSGLDEDRVDDLKIAVSEACANAVLTQPADGEDHLLVCWRQSDARLTVEISGGGAAPATDSASSDRLDMSVALLRSLVDECEFERSSAGETTARLTISL